MTGAVRIQIRTALATVVLSAEGGYHDPQDRFRIALFADGVDLGNPDQRTVTVPWRGADGDQVEVTGYGNRDQKYQIKVESMTGDSSGLEAGEAYISQVVGQPAEVWWIPPSGDEASAMVYEAVTSRLDFTMDDDGEIDGTPRRVFDLTVTAWPFGRRATETVVEAIGSGTGATFVPTTTVLNPATSTTGWATNVPGGVDGGFGIYGISNYNYAPGTPSADLGLWYLEYNGSWTMSGDRWLRIRFGYAGFSGGGAVPSAPQIIITHPLLVGLNPTAVIGDHAYYYLPATVTSITRIVFVIPRNTILIVREIARQNGMPYSTTAAQLSRAFDVEGTARTPISIEASHTGSLGEFLAYLRPEDGSGNKPPLREFRVASAAPIVADTLAYNGGRIDLTAGQAEVHDIPAGTMPESTYSVLVRHKPTTTAGITWTVTASTVVGASTLGSTTSTPYRDGNPTSDFATVDLGLIVLPTVRIPRWQTIAPTTAKVRLTLSASIAVGIDEVWLFDVVRGRLIRVDCGAGTPAAGGSSNRVWIDGMSALSSQTSVYVGTTADRSDARHAVLTAITSLQDLVAVPGPNTLFTACKRENAAVGVRYFARGYHHVGAPE